MVRLTGLLLLFTLSAQSAEIRGKVLIPNILLWLLVINLGIAFGAGLYEARITVPQWLSFSPASGYTWNAAAAREANVGLRFWVYVTTVPLTLLTLAGLVAVWWTQGPVRSWWLVAIAATLVDRIMTFGYFIPTILRLMRSDAAPHPEVGRTAARWVKLGYVRHAATLIAWLAALRALTLAS